MKCPFCEDGTVYANTPSANSTSTKTNDEGELDLVAAEYLGARCCNKECRRETTKGDAAKFNEWERSLQKMTAAIEHDGSKAKLDQAEKLVKLRFSQHVLADLLHEQMIPKIRNSRKEHRRLLELRCEFHKAAYPGLSGAHAWALEAYADALAQSAETKRPSGDSGSKSSQSKKDSALAIEIYEQAQDVLTKMFGEDHDYVTTVSAKITVIKKL